MNEGTKYVRDQAMKAAARRLKAAAVFVKAHIDEPLFQKRKGSGKNAELVSVSLLGVLSVYDFQTGALLGFSEPGKPDVLSTSFEPVLPTSNGSD